MIELTALYPGWSSTAEKEYVLKRLLEAKNVYRKLGSLLA